MDKVGLFLRAKANVYHLHFCGAGMKHCWPWNSAQCRYPDLPLTYQVCAGRMTSCRRSEGTLITTEEVPEMKPAKKKVALLMRKQRPGEERCFDQVIRRASLEPGSLFGSPNIPSL